LAVVLSITTTNTFV